MTAAAVSGDAWKISGEDRAKHDTQFFNLKPVNGFITGEQARGFFMQSGLPTQVLGKIWELADMNNDGKMDKKEFSIAMHLIKKKLQGYEIPKTLPQTLKADPVPMVGSFGAVPIQPGMLGMASSLGLPPVGMVPNVSVTMPQLMPMMANGLSQIGVAPSGFIGVPVPSSAGVLSLGSGTAVPTSQSAGSLAMPHHSKLKYTQMFNSNDHNKRGTLTGVEARSILIETGVPQQMLAQIWNLSDFDKDGKLDCDEFCIAMHLTDVVKMGRPLPPKLPPELHPKAKTGNIGSGTAVPIIAPQMTPVDSFGELLGSMGMSTPVQTTEVTNGDIRPDNVDISQVSFEDKRKQNFDKGQAELERRRQQLQGQLKQEEEARIEKERKEQEKMEQIRQEQERKKQQELERQLERQREIERQKEEQRQKMMEQREAARRELEHQRQIEWEHQRKEQLMVEKSREYEELMALKSKSSNSKCEVESLKEKKRELCSKISQVKNSVQDFTTQIEAMRSTRDLKNNHIDRLQSEIWEFNQKLQAQQSQRQTVNLKVQTSSLANTMSETQRTIMHSVELKKTSLQRLKKDLEQLETDTSKRLAEIDTQNIQLKELDSILNKLQADINKTEQQKQTETSRQEGQERLQTSNQDLLRKEMEAQILKDNATEKRGQPKRLTENNWLAFGGETNASVPLVTDNWTSVFDAQPSSKSTADVWGVKSIDGESSDIWGSEASENAKNDEWSASFSSHTAPATEQSHFKLTGSKKKYKALYQFDARNLDELSLSPGDIVMVYDDQAGSEQGWLGGELNGKRGWFPKAYVEQMEDESSCSAFGGSADATTGISTSEDSSFMAVMPVAKVLAVSPTPGQGKVAPDGVQAQALYPWKAKKDNHLSFNKGDIIRVKEQQDMWWSGEIGGKTGWFPKSYVKLVSGPNVAGTVTPTLAAMPAVMNDAQTIIVTSEKPADQLSGDQYICMYAYQSSEPGDLTFNQGEIVTVTTMDGDWWSGTIENRCGIFPANYVKKYNALSKPSVQLSLGSQGAGTLKKPEIAAVIAAYTATGEEQLSLSPGQLIHVRKKSPSGWWEGELQARGQKRKIGWFPANYVKLLAGSSRNTPDNILSSGGRASPASLSMTSTLSTGTAPPTSAAPHPATKIYNDHVIALYPYNAQHADELTFPKDAVINVVKKDDPDWWQGEYNGQTGMFPSNYVQNAISPDTASL